ncbi:WD repeat-containing protein 73 [Portunus trituberculatus]|uniref:WD repeat-containing protein 73 n=1 Tax=Portunus trituberculatus TaxID=210409 RepID=A0A5B7CUI9_PORTR|nr:WD repeat-containing protein 73 [Portunus trituberculatus]
MEGLGMEEESDDEWFYSSIRRYDDLLMYDVHGDISCSTFYDSTKILLGVSRGSLHELLLLSVPDKLLAGRNAGLVKSRDFNQVAAAYTATSVKKLVRVGSRVVAAEEGGIYLYSVPDPNNASDVISLLSTLKKDVAGKTVLAVSGNHVYAGDSLSNLSILDLSSEKAHIPVTLSNATKRNGDISEIVSVDDKLYICLKNEGCLLICDHRTNSILQEVQVKKPSGVWTMNASKDGNFVALASSRGRVSVLDTRYTHREVFSHSLEYALNRTGNVTVHFSPSDPLLSVSGLNSVVEIMNYKCGEGDSKVFSHDGHRGKCVHTIVTHLWHPLQKNLLFSADDTGKINAWRFKQSVHL